MSCPNNVVNKKASRKSIPEQLQDLVKDYLTTIHEDHKGRKGTYKELHELYLSDLKGIYDFICGAEGNDGNEPYKLDSHQWHFKLNRFKGAVGAMADALSNIDNEKRQFDSFRDIIMFVDKKKSEKKKNEVFGFGNTCVYDFALRWGWNNQPRYLPEDEVWLHTKPLESARKLKKMGFLKKCGRRVPMEYFSEEIRQPGMDSMDIEHFLCIYGDSLKDLYKQYKNNKFL